MAITYQCRDCRTVVLVEPRISGLYVSCGICAALMHILSDVDPAAPNIAKPWFNTKWGMSVRDAKNLLNQLEGFNLKTSDIQHIQDCRSRILSKTSPSCSGVFLYGISEVPFIGPVETELVFNDDKLVKTTLLLRDQDYDKQKKTNELTKFLLSKFKKSFRGKQKKASGTMYVFASECTEIVLAESTYDDAKTTFLIYFPRRRSDLQLHALFNDPIYPDLL